MVRNSVYKRRSPADRHQPTGQRCDWRNRDPTYSTTATIPTGSMAVCRLQKL